MLDIYCVVHTCRDSVTKVYLKIKTVSTCKLQNNNHYLDEMVSITYVSCMYIYTSDCLRFAFMDLLETELNQIAMEWNTHRMRPTRLSHSPPGIPDELYFIPELAGRYKIIYGFHHLPFHNIIIIGTRDYICTVSQQDLQYIRQYIRQYTSTTDPPAPLEFLDAAEIVMVEKNLDMPTNISEALLLFIELVSVLN